MSELVGIVIAIAGFFGGSLVTVVGFVIPLGNRMTRVEAKVDMLVGKFEALEQNRPACYMHTELETSSAVHAEQMRAQADRIDNVEKILAARGR